MPEGSKFDRAGEEVAAETIIKNTDLEKQSAERAVLFLQDVGIFEEYQIDPETGDRLPATPEQKAEMDEVLRALHNLFTGAPVDWRLDGGFNISIYRGAYIGHHKDVDLAIPGDRKSLDALDSWLGQRGYGLFLSQHRGMIEPDSRHAVQRADGRGILQGEEDGRHTTIAAIDERSAIRLNDKLKFIDVHVEQLDSSGGIIKLNVVLPPAWSAPQPRIFNGIEINTSHPALLVYHKLHESRSYDQLDVRKIVESGVLTADDIEQISQVIQVEKAAVIDRLDRILGSIAERVTPEMNVADVVELWLSEPEVAANLQRGMRQETVAKAATVMLQHASEGRAGMVQATAEHLGMEVRFQHWERNVAQLRAWWNEKHNPRKTPKT